MPFAELSQSLPNTAVFGIVRDYKGVLYSRSVGDEFAPIERGKGMVCPEHCIHTNPYTNIVI